jgi:hypothetical protein
VDTEDEFADIDAEVNMLDKQSLESNKCCSLGLCVEFGLSAVRRYTGPPAVSGLFIRTRSGTIRMVMSWKSEQLSVPQE